MIIHSYNNYIYKIYTVYTYIYIYIYILLSPASHPIKDEGILVVGCFFVLFFHQRDRFCNPTLLLPYSPRPEIPDFRVRFSKLDYLCMAKVLLRLGF